MAPSAPRVASPRLFTYSALVVLVCFTPAIVALVRFGLQSELYSYIVIIPIVCAYLVWLERDRLSPSGDALPRFWAGAALLPGAALTVWSVLEYLQINQSDTQDVLAFTVYAFVALLAGFACLWLGRGTLRVAAFPLAFLVFMAPLPVGVERALEAFLQHGSALVAHGLFGCSGMPVFRDHTYFRLPGFSMEVAPECSGIRSTVALFITSLVAGKLMLRTAWKRIGLATVVVPIALLRNGFRVFTIGQLCVRIGPEMIESYIHRHGGPIFFALSLVPFSLILLCLVKSDRKLPANSAPPPSTDYS